MVTRRAWHSSAPDLPIGILVRQSVTVSDQSDDDLAFFHDRGYEVRFEQRTYTPNTWRTENPVAPHSSLRVVATTASTCFGMAPWLRSGTPMAIRRRSRSRGRGNGTDQSRAASPELPIRRH